jgi:hypothetical protein
LGNALPEEYGISALDAKSYALEKGTFSSLLRKFTENEVDTLQGTNVLCSIFDISIVF